MVLSMGHAEFKPTSRIWCRDHPVEGANFGNSPDVCHRKDPKDTKLGHRSVFKMSVRRFPKKS